MSAAERARRLAVVLLAVAASTGMVALLARIAAPWVPLGFIAFVPWLLALERARSTRGALGAAWAMSVGYSFAIFSWFPSTVGGYTGLSPLGGWLVLLVLGPLLQGQFLAFALARRLAKRWAPPGAFLVPALAGALVYVGTEWLWPKLFVDTLGYGLYPSVYLRQLADLAGVPGLTLVLLLSNECIAELARAVLPRAGSGALRHARVPALMFVGLLVASFTYGYLRHRQVTERLRQAPGIVVGAVQADLTQYDKLAAEMGSTYEVVKAILAAHYALSDEILRDRPADLLLWPETVYPTTFGQPRSQDGEDFDAEIARFVQERGVPLIFGAYDADKGREFNAAVLLEPSKDGKLDFQTYRKTKLFPLTEYVPDALDTLWFRHQLPWTGTWKRGPGPRAISFKLRGGKPITLAPIICYETLFSGYLAEAARQGAELIVTLSNDSWFTNDDAPRYHLAAAAFRSIETRLSQARVTNSGISALIDPTGEVLAHTPFDARARLAASVPRMARLPTLVVAWGEWLGPTALVAAAVLLAGSGVASRRRKR